MQKYDDAASAYAVQVGEHSQAVDICGLRSRTTRQGKCHSQSENHPLNVPPH
ncbi:MULTISPECIES: hypothetical protein [unclassified Ensifer]|uniref:hypothetical protein n=1 Tax=unclassified Ensifer TaxID=2633371 RepID=UPI00137B8810|nr:MULTISPECIES: hypothetical protein [unclassified Ensifer]